MNAIRKWPVRLGAGALVCLCLGGVALAVGQQGTQSDPLVSVSYLNQQVTPAILEQVDARIAQQEADFRAQLSTIVNRYVSEVEDRLHTGGTAAGGSWSGNGGDAAYQVVGLSAGQTLSGGTGCEILLRSGMALCAASDEPGLVDTSAGSTLSGGGMLEANHLYLSPAEGHGLQAVTAVTLMVRGSYRIL